MAISSKLCICICFLVAISLIAPAPSQAYSPLFIFGDSNFDSGNNNYINTTATANFPPYGETFFHYPTGRFSNGRLLPDFIAEYAKLPFIQPYYKPGNDQFAFGVNFASGGSGVLSQTAQGIAVNLETQLSNFRNVTKQMIDKLGKKEAKQLVANAVYLFSVGGNDYFYPWVINASTTFFQGVSHGEYVNMVIGNITTVIKEIHDEGGRKFGFINMTPLDCYPLSRASNPIKIGDCIEELSTLVKLHNVALFRVLRKLQKELELFVYSLFDIHDAASRRMTNPSRYGFEDGLSACCGSGPYHGNPTCGRGTTYELCQDPNANLFWDPVHFTEKGHRQFAELMWNGTLQTTQPYNLKSMFEHILHE